MDVITRGDGVTVINDAYNANPDSMRAGLKALAWMARQGSEADRRSWAVLGEMAELGDDAISEHDRIGRLAVRLDVSRLIVVGTGRSMSAMHHGAVMEGSWGGEATMVADADAALALLRAELRPGDVVLVKASNAAGLGALADALVGDAQMRQILIAVGIALAVSILLTPLLIRLFTRQGFGHEIREDGPPSHQKKRGTPSMGGVAILAGIWAGYLGTHLIGHGARRRRAVRVGPAGARPGHRARRGRLRRRPDQDPPVAQPRPEQDRQDRRQLAAAVLFGVLALQFRNADGLTPGSAELSYVREIATVTLAPAVFVLFCILIVAPGRTR